jgi:Ohr subfamily peroxiredoxin
MVEKLYTAEATATGGRKGKAETSDGRGSVAFHPPWEAGRPATSTDPEQLFAMGYAACYGGAVELAAKQAGLSLAAPVTVHAKVSLRKIDPSPRFDISVELVVDLVGVTQEQADLVIAAAHRICPYSNSLQSGIVASTIARASAAAA